ncbi:MAG: hypothetical protein GQ574_22235 [Crocinitomix sp.]|nr:hypothetical protein [Crocinitomix sp.]
MKAFILILLFGVGFSSTAQDFERKVIVKDGAFYYVSVDDNLQIGTLYKGAMDGLLKDAKAYAIPAGRGVSAQTNPLAWDIDGEDMYAVNFMDHSLNDRYESIKKFAINDLKLWGANVSVDELIMQSVDAPMYVFNEPYHFIKERSDFLNHFYFDGVVLGGNYWMAVTNNEELIIWNHVGDEWYHSEIIENFKVDGPFTLLTVNEAIYLLTANGKAYEISISGGAKAVTFSVDATFRLKDVVLIDDRDKNIVYYMKRSQFNYEKSMTDMISEMAIKVRINE